MNTQERPIVTHRLSILLDLLLDAKHAGIQTPCVAFLLVRELVSDHEEKLLLRAPRCAGEKCLVGTRRYDVKTPLVQHSQQHAGAVAIGMATNIIQDELPQIRRVVLQRLTQGLPYALLCYVGERGHAK